MPGRWSSNIIYGCVWKWGIPPKWHFFFGIDSAMSCRIHIVYSMSLGRLRSRGFWLRWSCFEMRPRGPGIPVIGGNFYKKAPYFMGKSMVSCRLCLRPIHRCHAFSEKNAMRKGMIFGGSHIMLSTSWTVKWWWSQWNDDSELAVSDMIIWDICFTNSGVFEQDQSVKSSKHILNPCLFTRDTGNTPGNKDHSLEFFGKRRTQNGFTWRQKSIATAGFQVSSGPAVFASVDLFHHGNSGSCNS